MVGNDITYSSDIEDMILMNLDGWTIGDSASKHQVDTDISPFMTEEEVTTKANKVITTGECQLFYETTLNDALAYTNRLNVDDLDEVRLKVFLQAVAKWTASNLWNKYNIRINNEDMEDTYVQSYGGLLYKSALKTLQQFINQRINSLSSFQNQDDDFDKDIWIV